MRNIGRELFYFYNKETREKEHTGTSRDTPDPRVTINFDDSFERWEAHECQAPIPCIIWRESPTKNVVEVRRQDDYVASTLWLVASLASEYKEITGVLAIHRPLGNSLYEALESPSIRKEFRLPRFVETIGGALIRLRFTRSGISTLLCDVSLTALGPRAEPRWMFLLTTSALLNMRHTPKELSTTLCAAILTVKLFAALDEVISLLGEHCLEWKERQERCNNPHTYAHEVAMELDYPEHDKNGSFEMVAVDGEQHFCLLMTASEPAFSRMVATARSDARVTNIIIAPPDMRFARRQVLWKKEHRGLAKDTFVWRPTAELRWPYQRCVILDACFAMARLALPPYVMLEIVDWLPYVERQKRVKKVQLIEGVRAAVRRVDERRASAVGGVVV